MRKLLLKTDVSLDGYREGPKGAMDWFPADSGPEWRELRKLMTRVDTVILGRGMYAGYSKYWQGVLAVPDKFGKDEGLPFGGCDPCESERGQAEDYSHAPEVYGHPWPHDNIGKRQLLNPLRLLSVVPATERHCSHGPPYAADADATDNHGHDKSHRRFTFRPAPR
jgi:hypothetical protein